MSASRKGERTCGKVREICIGLQLLSKWGRLLEESDYDKKALEIILPDVIITEDNLKVLNEFRDTCKGKGIEVWYRMTK